MIGSELQIYTTNYKFTQQKDQILKKNEKIESMFETLYFEFVTLKQHENFNWYR